MQRALDASDNIPLEKLDNEELGNQVKRIEELPDPQRNKGFDQIAEAGDGELLARVHNELPEEQKAEFAVAIGDSNNPDAAVEFVNELKDQTTDERYRAEGGRFPISDGKFTDQHFDVDARSVAIVVGRLGDDPAHFEQAIDSLDDEQLDAVLDASTTSTFITKPDIGVPPKYEVQTSSGNFTNITAATGRSDNPELKARVFAAGTEQLEFLRSEDSSEDDRREVTDALSRIIDSDTTGVVKALDANNQGAVIKPYSRELIDLGQEDKISEHIAKLSTGNDLSADPVDYLSASERGVNGEFHANARAAGLYVGSVAGAIDDNISDKEDAAATINRVFGLGLGAGRIGGPTAAVLKELTRGIAGDITKSDIDSDRDLRQRKSDSCDAPYSVIPA